MRPTIGALLALSVLAGCSAFAAPPAEPEVTCIGFSAEACDQAWRTFLETSGTSAVDEEGRNRVVEVTVRKGYCDAAIDVRFSDGTGVVTAGGLC
jgi:hypothetical protein